MDREKNYRRSIFISSSVYRFKQERKMIFDLLQKGFNQVSFQPIMSEFPETYSIYGNDYLRADAQDPNLFILNKVKNADYFFLLIDDFYYGKCNIMDMETKELISIIHAEYRTAFRRALPIFVFLPKTVYIRYKRKKRSIFDTKKIRKNDDAVKVYQFMDEIYKRRKQSNFSINIYNGSIVDLREKIMRVFYSFDRSKFLESSYTKDIYACGESFEVRWIIENDGCVKWEGRYFVEIQPEFRFVFREIMKLFFKRKKITDVFQVIARIFDYVSALGSVSTAEKQSYSIPTTYPGETVELKVRYTAPMKKKKVFSIWKMKDSDHNFVFSDNLPLMLDYECVNDDRKKDIHK